MTVAISTSWNSFLHHSGRDLVKEINHFGFNRLELGFNLTATMVEEIAILQEEGLIEVGSVHNFCPIPSGIERNLALPDCFPLSSLNKKIQGEAIFFTKRTIDTASRLKAQAVVLHTGRVNIQDRTKELIHLFNEGKKNTLHYMGL